MKRTINGAIFWAHPLDAIVERMTFVEVKGTHGGSGYNVKIVLFWSAARHQFVH